MKLFKNNLVNPIILFACFLIMSACIDSTPNNSTQTDNDSIKTAEGGFTNNESTYYRFPTPDEIFSFIDNEKLKFNPSLLNPSTNSEKYLDSKSQTLALGAYISDLAYITMFESYNKSIEYYGVIHLLSDKIRISSTYDLEISKRIEKNLLNLDSLKTISTDSYSSIVEYLIVNNREKTLALIAAGAYVECFHIAFQLAGNYSKNNTMLPKIVDLKFAFENLYSYLQIYSDSEDVKQMAEKLKPLSDLFKQLDKNNSSKTTVKQDKEGNIVLGGGTTFEMDSKLFAKIKGEVAKVRSSIINNN